MPKHVIPLANSRKEHIFHFVLHSSLKNELERASMLMIVPLNGMITMMLETMLPILDTWYLIESEDVNSVEKVNWDCECHISINENLYRRLKQVHSNMNTFSIARIVRSLLRLFLRLYKHGGIDYINRVVRRFVRLKLRLSGKSGVYDKRNYNIPLDLYTSLKIQKILHFNEFHQLIKSIILQ